MLLRLTIITVLAAVTSRAALAGDCTPDVAAKTVADHEAYAKKPGKLPPDAWKFCVDTIAHDAKLTKRFLAACEVIVGQQPSNTTCIEWGIKLGAERLGGHELFDLLGKSFHPEPFTWADHSVELYSLLDDARVPARLLEIWREASAKLAKQTLKKAQLDAWGKWRSMAIKVLGKRGDATTKTFLEEQAALEKDAHRAKLIKNAIAAIDKRTQAAKAKP